MKATEQYCPMVPFVCHSFTRSNSKLLSFSEPEEISHANDDCGDDDDKRYLNLTVFSKACC